MCTRFLKSLLVKEDAVESKVDSKLKHDSDEDEDMNADSDWRQIGREIIVRIEWRKKVKLLAFNWGGGGG